MPTSERLGFLRPVGPAGARDRVLVLPSVVCAALVAERLASDVAVALPHQHGCLQVGDDLVYSERILGQLGHHPNVAATLVVSLGCETLSGRRLAEGLRAAGRPVELVEIQRMGGTAAAMEAGREFVDRLYARHGGRPRERVPASDLTMGLDAGDEPLAAAITAEATSRGVGVVRAGARGQQAHPELAAQGAQVIVSLVEAEQAPVGFALCPVLAVSCGGELHAALAGDFDVVPDGRDDRVCAHAILDRVEATFDGSPTAAEVRGAGEFSLRRLAVTM